LYLSYGSEAYYKLEVLVRGKRYIIERYM